MPRKSQTLKLKLDWMWAYRICHVIWPRLLHTRNSQFRVTFLKILWLGISLFPLCCLSFTSCMYIRNRAYMYIPLHLKSINREITQQNFRRNLTGRKKQKIRFVYIQFFRQRMTEVISKSLRSNPFVNQWQTGYCINVTVYWRYEIGFDIEVDFLKEKSVNFILESLRAPWYEIVSQYKNCCTSIQKCDTKNVLYRFFSCNLYTGISG